MTTDAMLKLADECEQRALEYVGAAFLDRPWDKEEREKFRTADSLFHIAAALKTRASQ